MNISNVIYNDQVDKHWVIKVFLGILFFLAISVNSYADFNERFAIGYTSYAEIKTKLNSGDSILQKSLMMLIKDADEILQMTPPSVIDDQSAPKGSNPHDYVSYAPYWWPNPKTANGLPYIRKDGQINVELREKGDAKIFIKMALSVHTLSLAYFYTEKEKYASKAEKFLSTWFLDSATLMNPNVNHGQIVLGRQNHGRWAGVNEVKFICHTINDVCLLSKSESWTPEKNIEFKGWINQYFEWLCTSAHGIKEKARPNNHGTWYDVQFVSIALYVGKDSLARNALEKTVKNRIRDQIEPNGMQPLEVKRGFSLHYSIYNLNGFFALATIAERMQIDLWTYKAENGASLQTALDYVLPYVGNQVSWPHPDLGRGQGKNWYVLLSQSVRKYGDERYLRALDKAIKNDIDLCSYCYQLVVPN